MSFQIYIVLLTWWEYTKYMKILYRLSLLRYEEKTYFSINKCKDIQVLTITIYIQKSNV